MDIFTMPLLLYARQGRNLRVQVLNGEGASCPPVYKHRSLYALLSQHEQVGLSVVLSTA